jgi:hypothetical protein
MWQLRLYIWSGSYNKFANQPSPAHLLTAAPEANDGGFSTG